MKTIRLSFVISCVTFLTVLSAGMGYLPNDALYNELDLSWISETPNFNFQWRQVWGGPDPDSVTAIAVDSDREVVYLAGGTPNFGCGDADAFLLKYAFNGSLLWNCTWGGPASDEATGLAVTAAGDVYLVGETRSYGQGEFDIFLARFSATGGQIWNRTWGGPAAEYDARVASSSEGHAVIAGRTYSFGSLEGRDSSFLLYYSPGGELLWNRTWGILSRTVNLAVHKVTVAPTDSILILGSERSLIIRPFLLKYDLDGDSLWNLTFQELPGIVEFLDVTFGPNETIWAAGFQMRSNSPTVGLICVFDRSGNLAKIRKWRSPTSSGLWLRGIARLSDGDLIVGGNLERSFHQNNSIIFASITESGVGNWNLTWTDQDYLNLKGLALSEQDDLFLASSNGSALLLYFAPTPPRSKKSTVLLVESIAALFMTGIIVRKNRSVRKGISSTLFYKPR